ncbi:MAG: M23 family metallopeptidase [Bacteroidota bacterium]
MDELTDKSNQTRWQRFRERMNNRYLMTVMNEETFEEVRSFQLSLGNVYLAISSIVVLVAIAVVLIIAYTPVKQYLPGFGNIVEREELNDILSQVTILERELEAQTAYADNFRSLLLGKHQSAEEAEANLDTTHLHNIENIEEVTLSAEEIQLRREMELEAVGQAARNGNREPIAGSLDVPLEQLFLVAPIRGEITGAFNPDDKHNGVDIIAPKGTAIKAAMNGYVVLSDYTYDTGYTIGLQHQNGVITFYKHNSELLKEVGSFVQSGEAIAIIGNTGHQTTGPHLHFELWLRGVPIDPVDYITF